MVNFCRLAGLAILLVTLNGRCQAPPASRAQKHKNPTAPIATTQVKQAESTAPQTESEKHVDADVRIIKSADKDGYDIASFWVNIFLALVGVGGITVGICTLAFLKKQTAEMVHQRVVMRRSLNTIRRQANLMEGQLSEMEKTSELGYTTVILQFRPKLIVRHARVIKFSDNAGDGVFIEPVRCTVVFQIVNVGGTPAHVVGGDIHMLSARFDDPELELEDSTHVGISERTLQAGERENLEFHLNTRIPYDSRWVEIHEGLSSHSIYLLGEIWYRDDLGIPRQTGIHRRLNPTNKLLETKKDAEEEYSD